jgi:hypothetical protein
MFRIALATCVCMMFIAHPSEARAEAQNTVTWDPLYPQGGRGNFKVKGTSTAKPGWEAVSVTLSYRKTGTNDAWTAVLLETNPNNWGEYTQSASHGTYDVKITVQFREIANPSNTESKTIEGQVTVRPMPDF